jgi:hypothetical protein
MAKTSVIMLGLSVIAIGLGVPAACLYASVYYGFSAVIAAVVSGIALFAALGIGAMGVIMGPLGDTGDDMSRMDRERLRAFRAHQRTTLEELDDIISVLGEIRDVLKSVEE